jgi:hypothetical protein
MQESIAQSIAFWQKMWVLANVIALLGIVLLPVVVVGRVFSLSWRIRASAGLGLLLVVIGYSYLAGRLSEIDRLSYEARIFWPMNDRFAWVYAVTVCISLLVLVATIVSRTYKHIQGPFATLLLIALAGFFLLPSQMGNKSTDMPIIDLYNYGIQGILGNDLTAARSNLEAYSRHAWLLEVWRPHPWYNVDPNVGDSADILAAIDGGSLSKMDISDCKLAGKPVSIAYAIKPFYTYAILVNILSDGRVYMVSTDGSFVAHYGVAPMDGSQAEGLGALMAGITQEQPLKYQCPECYEEVVAAFIRDPAFASTPAIQIDRVGSLEYYNVCCGGQQVNGYWEPDNNTDTPPWTGFRQAIFKVITETAAHGEPVSIETYLDEIKNAQEQYGFRSLTGYEWSKLYLVGPEDSQ